MIGSRDRPPGRDEPATCETCRSVLTTGEYQTSTLFLNRSLCKTCLLVELEPELEPQEPHRYSDPGPPRLAYADARQQLYRGPVPKTVAGARRILDGLGVRYRYLPERVALAIFRVHQGAGLA